LFVALLTSGNAISLLEYKEVGELRKLRENENFYCPICREEVVLRLGNKRIHHFAHKKDSLCRMEYEPESAYHLQGKKDLFIWLKNQGLTVEVEPYIQRIHQRPDILVRKGRKTYALEFQCSPISEELFQKRTSSYLKAGIHPVWIHGASRLRYDTNSVINLPSFHWLFAHPHPHEGRSIIPYYCPHTKRFLLLFPLYPLSATKTFSVPIMKQLDGLLFPELFNNSCIAIPNRFWSEWLSHKKKYRLTFMLYPAKTTRYICSFFYKHNIVPSFFPIEAGLPQKYGYLFETPCFIWQTIILISMLESQQRRGRFTFSELYRSIRQFLYARKIKLRKLPLMRGIHFSRAIHEYITILIHLGYVKKTDGGYYLQKYFTLPKTMDEAIEKDYELLEIMKKGKVII